MHVYKEQAHDLISQLVESDDPEIELRCQRWINARFALHAKLYSREQEMMNDTFHEPFRRFVKTHLNTPKSLYRFLFL